MQPFERLRAIARWSEGLDEDSLIIESIDCLAGFDDDPAGLVVACRRLLSYHGYSARLWWICSRVIGALEPRSMAWDAWDQLENDATAGYLGEWLVQDSRPVLSLGWSRTVNNLGSIRTDLEILVVRTGDDNLLSRSLRNASISVRVISAVEATALQPSCVLLPIEIAAEGNVFVSPEKFGSLNLLVNIPTIVVAPIGTVLAENTLNAFMTANKDRRYSKVSGQEIDVYAGPSGVLNLNQFAHRRDAPDAPELLRYEQ